MGVKIFSSKIYRPILSFALSIAIASQSIYMFQPARAEAAFTKKQIAVVCSILLAGAAYGSTTYVAGQKAEAVKVAAIESNNSAIYNVIEANEKVSLASVLGTRPQPSAAQLLKFHREWIQLVDANVKAKHKLIPSSIAFMKWWNANEKSLLAQRGTESTLSMQDFLNAMSTVYAMENMDVQQNPRLFLTAIEGEGSGHGGLSAWAILALASIGGFLGAKLKDSFVFSQLSGSINAYFAGPMDTWQQWLRMKGINHLGWFTVMLNDRLFKSSPPPEFKGLDPNVPDKLYSPEEILAAEKNTVMTSRNSVAGLRKHFATLGFVADESDVFDYQERMKGVYIAFKNAWGSFLGDSLREGRSIKWDLFFRVRDFAGSARGALARADGYMNSFESVQRDIVFRNPQHQNEIFALLDSLPPIAKIYVANRIRNRPLANEKLALLNEAKQRLVAMNVKETQANRAIDTLVDHYVERRFATFLMINFLKHETEYREFRENVHGKHYREALRNREGMALDTTMENLRPDMLEIADELDFQLAVYQRHLDTLSLLSGHELDRKIRELRKQDCENTELNVGLPPADAEPAVKKAFMYSVVDAMRRVLAQPTKAP